MAFGNGIYKVLYIKVSTEWFPIGCLTSNSFSESVSMLGTTTRDNTNGWETSVPTTQSFNISFSGLLTFDDRGATVITYEEIKVLKRARTLIEWKIESSEGGDTESGYGYITSLSDSAEIDSFLSFTGEIKGYSTPTTTAGTTPSTLTLDDMTVPYEAAKID